jgi:hypothetical protein
MPVPGWTSTVVVYDNDLEYGWSRDRENNSNIGDTKIFVLLMTIGVAVSSPLGVPLSLLLYLRRARLQ